MCEHPGRKIEQWLKTTGMTRKELATRTGVTEKHINTLISGERNITVSFAKKLGYIFHVSETKPDDPKENAKYWQSLQNNYDIFQLQEQEKNNITQDEMMVLDHLVDVIPHMHLVNLLPKNLNSKIDKIIAIRNLFKISDLSLIPKLPCKGAAFRAQLATNVKIDKYVLFAWQAICELTTRTESVKPELNLELLKSKLNDIKNLMFDELNEGCRKLQEVLAPCGIAFNVVKHFRGAPVQGFIKQTETGNLILCLTIRGGRADTFWFTLFHEIAHILNKDYESKLVDFDSSDNEIELKADRWARDFLLPPEIYREITSLNRIPDWSDILRLANKARVKPYIVLGRLQKDGILEWSDFADRVQRYKWAE